MLKPSSSNNVTRVSKSAILAGAALALPFTSKADPVIHTASISVVSNNTTGDVSFDLNLNPTPDALADSINDFEFTASFGTLTDSVTALGSTGNGFDLTPLSSGAVVGSGSTFQTGTGILQQTPAGSPPVFEAGPWPGPPPPFFDKPNGFAYLGVEFNIDGALHYGWVHLSACTPEAFTECGGLDGEALIVVDSYAYEANANTAITIPGTATPEPSFLPLLALGAAGLGAFRSRRKKAA
jgi:hypothetical protein